MNGADIAILLVLAVSSLLSLMRGLVREILSLVSWVVSVWVAFRFCGPAGGLMGNAIAEGPLRTGVAFVASISAGTAAVGRHVTPIHSQRPIRVLPKVSIRALRPR